EYRVSGFSDARRVVARAEAELENLQAVVRLEMASPALESTAEAHPAAIAVLDPRREVPAMIILLHPRSTKPKNRRFPLAALSLGAVLEGREDYQIVDGNADPQPGDTLDRIMRENG